MKLTKNDKSTMGSEDLLKLKIWVDAWHALYEEMRGHTRGFFYCGYGIIHSKSSKQKFEKKHNRVISGCSQ